MCLLESLVVYCAKHSPRKFMLIGQPLLVSFMLSIIVMFCALELFYVAPKTFGDVPYRIYCFIGIFVMHNILGNMLACHCTKSSIAVLSEDRKHPAPEEEHLWRYCKSCQVMVPPRSWHCKLCNVCILKRDHHCFLTAACIGHHNHRYFFWFIFYMLLGISLSLIDLFALIAQESLPKDFSVLWLFILEVFAFCAAVLMWAFEVNFISRNTTYFGGNDDAYDMGIKENFAEVLGRRGFWTMLSPAIKSPLSHEGTQWRLKQDNSQIY